MAHENNYPFWPIPMFPLNIPSLPIWRPLICVTLCNNIKELSLTGLLAMKWSCSRTFRKAILSFICPLYLIHICTWNRFVLHFPYLQGCNKPLTSPFILYNSYDRSVTLKYILDKTFQKGKFVQVTWLIVESFDQLDIYASL